MNVLIVSTSERSGGGAIAARRLMEALRQNGVEARMMVRDKQTDDPAVVRVGNKIPKFMERLAILPHMSLHGEGLRSRLWQVDIANVGIDITRTREYREADVIHLHWVCQGMLSLSCIERILRSGKRVVWTLHDEWPYLGVCHYRADCTERECRRCPLMAGSTPYNIYMRKRAMYSSGRLTFVGCSQWITEQARLALPEADVRHVGNCIPSRLFHPTDMLSARRALGLPETGRILLFCSQRVTDERKGIAYLVEALKKTPSDSPLKGENQKSPFKGDLEGLHLLIVGKGSEAIALPEDIGVTRLGTVGEGDMPQVYSAADAFVTPSLQDNLPNTIAEAMSCGTPCVGFRVGGIPEMIDHQVNGYVAAPHDAADLAAGIRYVLSHDLRAAALAKASSAYSEAAIAQQYINIYEN